jgi:hypothetical protein
MTRLYGDITELVQYEDDIRIAQEMSEQNRDAESSSASIEDEESITDHSDNLEDQEKLYDLEDPDWIDKVK